MNRFYDEMVGKSESHLLMKTEVTLLFNLTFRKVKNRGFYCLVDVDVETNEVKEDSVEEVPISIR